MAANTQSASVGPTVALDVHCGCATTRRIPIRMASDGLAVLRSHLNGKLSRELPVMTYWCRHCKQLATLTVGDLYLAD